MVFNGGYEEEEEEGSSIAAAAASRSNPSPFSPSIFFPFLDPRCCEHGDKERERREPGSSRMKEMSGFVGLFLRPRNSGAKKDPGLHGQGEEKG